MAASVNRKKPHTVFSRSLIYKLQQELKKLIDICVSWSSQKFDQKTNFLNSENRGFENVNHLNGCLRFLYV